MTRFDNYDNYFVKQCSVEFPMLLAKATMLSVRAVVSGVNTARDSVAKLSSHPYQRRMFFDKVKAAASAFLQDPTSAMPNKGVKESERTHAGAPRSAAADPSGSKGGIFGTGIGSGNWSLAGTIMKFALKRIDKMMAVNRAEINDILFSSAQLLESDSRIVRIFGPFVKVQPVGNPLDMAREAAANNGSPAGTSGSVHVMQVGGPQGTQTVYQITTAVSGRGSGGGGGGSSRGGSEVWGASGVTGTMSITASVSSKGRSKGGGIEITSLQVQGPDGSKINILDGSGSGGDFKKRPGQARRVENVTTIDVEGK